MGFYLIRGEGIRVKTHLVQISIEEINLVWDFIASQIERR